METESGASQTGVLLINLGTPDAPTPRAVRRYLREFLSDPRVIDIPGPLRWLLLNLVILPVRPRRSARAYQAIWSERGSPLLFHGQALRDGVAERLGPDFRVELGMRYGQPSIESAVARLRTAGCERIVALPLFPQYSAAASASAGAKALEVLAKDWDLPALSLAGPFYDHPAFIGAFADGARAELDRFGADHVLWSFHGLPERQIQRSDPTGQHCLSDERCCDAMIAANRRCYRAQCFATARALASALALPPERSSVSFQSRLGRTPWIRPYTDLRLPELAEAGVKRLAVFCPAFVADCLETLEEIGLRASEQWRQLGGDALWLAPCPNAHPRWVDGVAEMVREAL